MNIPHHNRRGAFTLVEIMIVVAIIGLIVGIALPAFMKSRNQARKQVCIENLSKIEASKQAWAVEKNKYDGDTPTDDDLFGPTSFVKVKPICPGGGTYDLKTVGTVATCNIDGHVFE